MPIIIIAGEEEFKISRRIQKLKDELVDPAWASFNFQRFDSPDLKQVIDAAAAVPFGPGNKVILFEQCALFTKKRGAKDDDGGSKQSAKLIDDLDSSLKALAPNTYLLFSCIANFDSTLKVSKIFAKHADIQKEEKVKYYHGSESKELITFCNKEANRVHAYIEDDACYYLADSTEANLRQISSEIEKAAVYILPEKTIKLAHVQAVSPHFSQVATLMEHWAQGRKEQVLESISELQARQVSPHMVLAFMQTVLSKWVNYKTEVEKACAVPSGGRDVRRREVPLNEIARKIAFDGRMAWIIEQELKRIKGLSLEFLVDKKQQLTELEYLLKSGQMPEGHALEYFFTR